MTDEKGKILIALEVRVKQVLNKCDVLQKENAHLKEERQLLENQIAEAEEKIGRLKAKHDSLKMARTITAASVDVDAARIKLSKMVREVDKCINLLK